MLIHVQKHERQRHSDPPFLTECAGIRRTGPLRPASRDLSDDARSGNANHNTARPGRTGTATLSSTYDRRAVSRQNLLFTMEQNRQTSQRPRPQTFISTRMTSSPGPLSKTLNSTPQQRQFGGAERDRTADPLLAKQVLSQLSYSPVKLRVSTERVSGPVNQSWWARVDSNYRPHAYQACALTT